MAKTKKIDSKQAKARAKDEFKIHRTVQQSIPYVAAYRNGIIETSPGKFTRTYSFTDIDFRTMSDDEQLAAYNSFGKIINTFGDGDPQFISMNRPIDMVDFEREYLMKPRNDGLNDLRDEMNNHVRENIERGHGIESVKYFTLSTEAENVERADVHFNNLEASLRDAFKLTGGSVLTPLTFEERMELMFRLMHPYNNDPYHIDFDELKKSGKSSKDSICPDFITVNRESLELGDIFCSVLYLETIPSMLSTEFVSSIMESPYTMNVSIHFSGIPREKAIRMVRDQTVNINTAISEQQRKASQKGYSIDLVAPDLAAAKEDAESLLSDLRARDQRLFRLTMVVAVYAHSQEELTSIIKSLEITAQSSLCTLRKLPYQQEAGFGATLPLCSNKLSVYRTLTTETAGLFMPFAVQRVMQKGGFSYGIHAVSKNVIILNRLSYNSSCGLVLGQTGSGKSFAVKKEIMSVILGSDADGFVVDPEGEYHGVAKLVDGEVIRLAAGGNMHINPLDLNIRIADDDDPIAVKGDYLVSLVEIMYGSRYGLEPVEKSIIFRCTQKIYQPYLEYMHAHPELDIDREQSPTLVDFYNALMQEAKTIPEAMNLALAIEQYCTGPMALFAQKTNVKLNKRLVVYDIKDIGTNLKPLALQVCLQDIWNRTIENRKKNKRTWSWFDEFHLLARSETAMQFIQQFYKRARKWGGVPTGITQNVEDMLQSAEARTLITNSEFVLLLNMSSLDIDLMTQQHVIDISPGLYKYISNVPFGHGLICVNDRFIPFEDIYDKDTLAYAALSTHPNDQNTVFGK